MNKTIGFRREIPIAPGAGTPRLSRWEGFLTAPYLSDALWLAIAPVLPGKVGDPGCSGRDNRAFIEGVFWIARTGSPWRDLPSEFGKWYTTYTRFNRWAKKDVWPEVIAALEAAGCHEFSFDSEGLHWTPAGEFSAGNQKRKAGQAVA